MRNTISRSAKRIISAVPALLAATTVLAGAPVQSFHWTLGEFENRLWAVPAASPDGGRPVLFLSTDNGESWDATVPMPTGEFDVPAIPRVAANLDTVFVGTDGEGVFYTDNGRSWEKWNEADVGIRDIATYGGTVGVVTSDGATFIGSGNGFHLTFTQAYELPLGATALSLERGLVIGTEDGHLYERRNDGAFHLTDGEGSRPGPFPGAVRQILELPEHRIVVVEDSEGRNRIYSKVNWSYVGPADRLLVDGAPVYVDAIARAGSGLGIITSEPAQRLLYTCDNGAGWTEIPLPVADGVNSFTMSACSETQDWIGARLATDEGGFRTVDDGVTWTPLGNAGGPGTGSLRIANSDLGVRLVSPSPNAGTISNTIKRFEIDVTNHGSERVEDIGVLLDFTIWTDNSNTGSGGSRSGLRIDGSDCVAEFDNLGTKLGDCFIAALEPGESKRIVWDMSLAVTVRSIRLEAAVDSARVRDDNPNNDRLHYSVNVRDPATTAAYNGEGGGGGGSCGLCFLVALLAAVRRNRVTGTLRPEIR